LIENQALQSYPKFLPGSVKSSCKGTQPVSVFHPFSSPP